MYKLHFKIYFKINNVGHTQTHAGLTFSWQNLNLGTPWVCYKTFLFSE